MLMYTGQGVFLSISFRKTSFMYILQLGVRRTTASNEDKVMPKSNSLRRLPVDNNIFYYKLDWKETKYKNATINYIFLSLLS